MANNQSVRRHLDAFTRGRILGKLEEGRSVTSVAAEFGIAHSIVSRLWTQFQTTGKAIRGFSSGRPRGTTPADDRYIVLQARRNRRHTAGEIARHTTQATGRPISRFTVARRLHGGGLFARLKTGCFLLDTHHMDVSAFSRIALHATFSIKLLFIPLISLFSSVAYIYYTCPYVLGILRY
ncbi:transposable element Tcb2 transposase [Trichonephila clavipes]|nr:transposable element Tcb2 transposase [Trichonephila clavipes]